MPILPAEYYVSTKIAKKSIKESIKMNSTKILFWNFYDASRLRCIKYAEDENFRASFDQDYLKQSHLDCIVSKEMIDKRPISEKLEIFKQLKQELFEMTSGDYWDKPILNNASEIQKLKIIAEQHERIDDFNISFLG